MARKLELGSGNRPQPGYEHLDFRASLPDIDHVHDLRKPLPFSAASFDEVLADNVFEHIPWIDALTTLRDWARVLKPGGKLVIIVPNFRDIVLKYMANTGTAGVSPHRSVDAKKGLGVWNSTACTIIKLFGGQEYAGNFHFAAYDEPLLRSMFVSIGLINIESAESHALKVTGVKR